MKKILLFVLVCLLGTAGLKAQGSLKAGINAGLPTGDIEEFSNFQLGADLSYLFGVHNMLEIGPMVGYSRFFTEDIDTVGEIDVDVDDGSFLPIAASGRVGLGKVFLGADLGYAVSLNDGGEGGFYYRPKIGVGVGGFSVVGSYSGISNDGVSIASVNLGLEFGL